MGRTNSKPAVRSSREARARAIPRAVGVLQPRELPLLELRHQEFRLHESFTFIRSPASGDHAVDGGRAAGGGGCIYATARLRAAGGRLSNHSGRNVLSGGGSRGSGFVGDFTAGAAVRSSARAEPDDLDEFVRQFGDHAAVRARPEY